VSVFLESALSSNSVFSRSKVSSTNVFLVGIFLSKDAFLKSVLSMVRVCLWSECGYVRFSLTWIPSRFLIGPRGDFDFTAILAVF